MKTKLDQNHCLQRFNTAASTYDDHAIVSREVLRRLLERLDYMRIEPTVIVDLGARTGMSTQMLSEKYPGAKLIAIEPAYSMGQKIVEQNKVQILTSPLTHLPLISQSADLVIAHFAMHWLNDIPQFFAEIRRILKPEGILLFTTLGPDTFSEVRAAWQQVDNHLHVHEFIDMHDVGDMLLAAELRDPVMDMEKLVVNYRDIQQFYADMRGQGITNVAENRQQGLTTPRQLSRFERAFQTDQGFPVTYEILYGHAWGAQVLSQEGEVAVPLSIVTGLSKAST